MRIIHRASLVFFLKDIYSKSPITSAVILCNGKQNPYTRKSDGHYVFSNLNPGEYDISISCVGYVPLEFKVNLHENETVVMPITMPYSVDNAAMQKITHFNISVEHLKKPLEEEDLTLRLCNELKFMKITEPVLAGSDVLKLNIEDLTPGILGQTYLYRTKEKDYEFSIISFDPDKKAYILRDLAEEEIPSGGKIYAIWHLKTDVSGRITMPYMSQFMTESTADFECISNDCKGKISFNIEGKGQSAETISGKVRLRKIVKKKS